MVRVTLSASASVEAGRAGLPRMMGIHVNGRLAGMIRTTPDAALWLMPQWQGQGIGLRAGIMALTRHFEGGAPEARVMAADGNTSFVRLLLRLGFEDDSWSDRPGRAMRLTRARFAALHPLTVTTPRTVMAPPAADDLGPLQAIATLPQVARMLFIFAPGMTAEAFAATHPAWTGTRPVRLAIRSAGRVVGSIGLGAGVRPPIFYFLDPAVAGQGLASEVVAGFVTEVTDRFGLTALQAEVFDDNPASARVLQKAGFHRAGAITRASAGRGGAEAPAHGFEWQPPPGAWRPQR